MEKLNYAEKKLQLIKDEINEVRLYTSAREVPCGELYTKQGRFGLCWFDKNKIYRVFSPNGKFDFKTSDEVVDYLKEIK